MTRLAPLKFGPQSRGTSLYPHGSDPESITYFSQYRYTFPNILRSRLYTYINLSANNEFSV